MLEDFRVIQVRALKVITKGFRVTARAALDIEAYVLFIKQRFEKLTNDTMLRIMTTSFYKQIINKRFKAHNKRTTSLKMLTVSFRKLIDIRTRNIKKIVLFIESS